MLLGLYISASGLEANERRMAVGANNLANVNTVGFKVDEVVVEPLPRTGPQGSGTASMRSPGTAVLGLGGGGVRATRSITEFIAGPLDATGQPFDIALDTGVVADGFLGVQGADGKGRWTRDGRLTLDSAGRLVTQVGRLPVLDEQGQPIVIDPAGGAIAIDEAGRLHQGGSDLARLRLASFDRPDLLTKQGAGQFAAGGTSQPGSFRGRVLQGHLEGSAADATGLLVTMIQVQRAYEANANMIRCQDQTLGLAVNTIAKI